MESHIHQVNERVHAKIEFKLEKLIMVSIIQGIKNKIYLTQRKI